MVMTRIQMTQTKRKMNCLNPLMCQLVDMLMNSFKALRVLEVIVVKKNQARQVSRRPVSGVLVGVRAGRSSTASDQRARGRNLQHRSDYASGFVK